MEFANFTFHEYGDKVKNWITFNEPWVFSRSGYDTGKKAPGRCSPYIKDFGPLCQDGRSGFEAYVVSHNLLVSHAEAVDAFRKCEKVKDKTKHRRENWLHFFCLIFLGFWFIKVQRW